MARHIGIVAVTVEGAALCYRTICLEAPALMGPDAHPEVSLHAHAFADYARRLRAADWEGVGALMLDSAGKLAAAGADFLVCPANTMHAAFPHVRPRSLLPWLHIADIVAEEAAARGFHRLGVLGTRALVTSSVYDAPLAARGLSLVRPDEPELELLDRMILTEMARGVFHDGQREALARIMTGMQAAGCDALALACTELPLVVSDESAPLPTLDSTRLLARAAVRRAMAA